MGAKGGKEERRKEWRGSGDRCGCGTGKGSIFARIFSVLLCFSLPSEEPFAVREACLNHCYGFSFPLSFSYFISMAHNVDSTQGVPGGDRVAKGQSISGAGAQRTVFCSVLCLWGHGSLPAHLEIEACVPVQRLSIVRLSLQLSFRGGGQSKPAKWENSLTLGHHSRTAVLLVSVNKWRQLGANSQPANILQDFQLFSPLQQ